MGRGPDIYFSLELIQMANRYVETCSNSQSMQIKTTMSYHLTPIRMAIINKTSDKQFGEVVEKKELSFTAGGNVNWYSHYWKTVWWVLRKLMIELLPCQGSSVGQSIIPIYQGCMVNCHSGHIQESTNEYINKWNNKLMFLSLPSSLSLSNQ